MIGPIGVGRLDLGRIGRSIEVVRLSVKLEKLHETFLNIFRSTFNLSRCICEIGVEKEKYRYWTGSFGGGSELMRADT